MTAPMPGICTEIPYVDRQIAVTQDSKGNGPSVATFGGRWEHLAAGRHFLQDSSEGKWHVVFARVSTGDQLREGRSLSQQIDDGLQLAERQGRPIQVLYVDPGKSATKLSFDEREGVRMLLDDVKTGRVATVYVYRRDRVARVSGEWLHFWKTCQKFGVTVEFTCPQEPPLGKGVYGKVQEAFMSLWAELEAELISIRVRDSLVSRFEHGEWVGGVLPYGLMRGEDGRIEPQPDEAPIVQEIFRLASTEHMGDIRIARHLNSIAPFTRRGFAWTREAVAKVVKNRIYCGYFSLCTTAGDGAEGTKVRLQQRCEDLPILVPESLWEQVNQTRRSRVRVSGAAPNRHYDSPNLLAGLLVCGECGRPMSSRHFVRRRSKKDGSPVEDRTRNYFCRNAQDGRGCGNRRNVAKEAAEEAVMQACYDGLARTPVPVLQDVLCDIASDRFRVLRDTAMAARSELGRTESAIQRNRVALERIKDPSQVHYYQARLSELLRRKAGQEERLVTVERQLECVSHPQSITVTTGTWSEVRARFEAAPADMWRAFLAEAIDKIVVQAAEESVEIHFRCPDPIGSPGDAS